MAPHNHLHQHYGRSSNDSNSRAQSSSSKAGGAKAPYKRSEVDEAAATHNAQVANTSTNRVGRWVQEQRGSAAMTRCSEEATRAASMNRRQTGATVHQSGQNGGTGSMIAAQQADDPVGLPIFASILRAFEERGFCLMGLSPHHGPLRITAALAATMTNSASGGRASASIPRQGGNSAASLPVGHRAEATSPALTSLEVMGAGSSALDGEAPGEEGSPGYGCGRESTTQLEQIEETETDGGSVGDGSTTVQ